MAGGKTSQRGAFKHLTAGPNAVLGVSQLITVSRKDCEVITGKQIRKIGIAA